MLGGQHWRLWGQDSDSGVTIEVSWAKIGGYGVKNGEYGAKNGGYGAEIWGSAT